MPVNAYLNFNGNCREAVEYYAEVFETEKPIIMTFGEGPSSPDYPLPDEAKHLVMHSQLIVAGSPIMFSDVFPGMKFTIGNNVNLTYMSSNEDELKAFFKKLSKDGKVGQELQETFWSKCYGSLTDKFGIEWQFSHEGEQSSM
ncbi:VOC family protein [Paenibacillus sp. sgz500958]|uniref:VOC family protein n=1 Tax=Paenibacillus sp. sgz500958 TaxID=3242475 RepID=UPI0036D3FF81